MCPGRLTRGDPQPQLAHRKGAQVVLSQLGCVVEGHPRPVHVVRAQGRVVPVHLKVAVTLCLKDRCHTHHQLPLSTLNEYNIFIFKVKHGICDTTIILWLWYSGITPRYNFGVKRQSLHREVCNINIISWRGPDHSHTMFHGMYNGAGYMGSV